MKKKSITVRLDDDQDLILRKYCKIQKVKISKLIRYLLKEFLSETI